MLSRIAHVSRNGGGLRAGSALSRFERLAALQATGSIAGRDQAAKRAHPLRREIAISRGYSQQLSQRRSHVGTQATNTAKKRLREGSHEIPHIQTAAQAGSPAR